MTRGNSARRGRHRSDSERRLGQLGLLALGQVGKAASASIRVANTDGQLGLVPGHVRLNPSRVYRQVEPRGCVPAVGLSPRGLCAQVTFLGQEW
jgi:hypothetical protein